MDLSGNMVRQVEQDMAVEDDGSHVANIGKARCPLKLSMQSSRTINAVAFL
jgi:capping protein beta